jgi:CRISPR/Cas system-associated exonuclease Cas4 (RecB family)
MEGGSTMTQATLFNRGGAKDLQQSVRNTMGRGEELANAIVKHFDKITKKNIWADKEIETLLLRQKEYEVSLIGKKPTYPREYARFSPSSADSCNRELFYKNLRAERDESEMTSWQRRWTENSTGVHEARQRNLLYGEKYVKNPDFTVERIVDKENPLRDGLPAWEKPLEGWKVVEHKGVTIVVTGMMDGILKYKDGSRIGFEFKTKSNSVAQIKGLKKPAPHHKKQCIAYSILFGIDEFVLTYESVAKDKWGTGELGRPDMKAFYIKVTERQREQLLDKWAGIGENVETGELPLGDNTKCMFCQFKGTCSLVTGGIRA